MPNIRIYWVKHNITMYKICYYITQHVILNIPHVSQMCNILYCLNYLYYAALCTAVDTCSCIIIRLLIRCMEYFMKYKLNCVTSYRLSHAWHIELYIVHRDLIHHTNVAFMFYADSHCDASYFYCYKCLTLKWNLICKFMTVGDSISFTNDRHTNMN